MIVIKNKLTVNDLQKKTFTFEIKGYKAEEVNEFLDQIQEDYIYFINDLDRTTQELNNLELEYERVSKAYEVLKEQNTWLDQQRLEVAKNELSNSDVMSRISQIEKNLDKVLKLLNK